jgi:sugar lactone lactonase YvrE
MTERTPAAEPTVLLDGIVLGESPRWHDGRLWLCDWGRQEVVGVDLDGHREVLADVPAHPWSIVWLPGGRLLCTAAGETTLTCRQPDGSLHVVADLAAVSDKAWNELVVDARGNAYVNGVGFDLMAGEAPRPGFVALVTPGGDVRQVAGDVEFPNGMAVTPDGTTLIVAESYGRRLTAFTIVDDGGLVDRRVWADLGDGTPDGICLDAEGAVWYADVPHRRCVRVAEGGGVLQTVDVDRGCFACMLGGDDGATLFIVAAEWRGPEAMFHGEPTGQVLRVPAPAPHAGWP